MLFKESSPENSETNRIPQNLFDGHQKIYWACLPPGSSADEPETTATSASSTSGSRRASFLIKGAVCGPLLSEAVADTCPHEYLTWELSRKIPSTSVSPQI